jgi:hypothetical protein
MGKTGGRWRLMLDLALEERPSSKTPNTIAKAEAAMLSRVQTLLNSPEEGTEYESLMDGMRRLYEHKLRSGLGQPALLRFQQCGCRDRRQPSPSCVYPQNAFESSAPPSLIGRLGKGKLFRMSQPELRVTARSVDGVSLAGYCSGCLHNVPLVTNRLPMYRAGDLEVLFREHLKTCQAGTSERVGKRRTSGRFASRIFKKFSQTRGFLAQQRRSRPASQVLPGKNRYLGQCIQTRLPNLLHIRIFQRAFGSVPAKLRPNLPLGGLLIPYRLMNSFLQVKRLPRV